MTTELGLNLAGVERVLELETKLERAQRRLEALERRSGELEAEIVAREAEVRRLEQIRQEVKAEIVRYEAPGTALIPVRRPGAGSSRSTSR
jgi:MerR family transcriptional regulator/heat shock protein HspR